MMNILPGEPVPPGFEDEINRVPEIQNAIDLYKGNALIGLEYTIELHEDDRRQPSYFCVLCDKRSDARQIMQHWTSLNHRLKYLEKHYPTVIRELNPIKYKPGSHALMTDMVQKLTEAIENHHGRLQLSVYGADEFRRLKNKLMTEVYTKFHHDERNGPNFLNIIDRSLWDNVPAEQTLQITLKRPAADTAADDANDGHFDEISSDSDAHDNSLKKMKKHQQTPAYIMLSNENTAARKKDLKLPTPKELSLQASHIAQERYKWEKYNCMLDIQLKQMEKIQLDYEKNPEKHPLYPEEWKAFWNRRYKELQQEKKVDPNQYDYKPEWITFWTKRLKQLFNEEVEKKKKEIKVKLGLPEDAVEKVDQLKEKYKVQVFPAAGASGGGSGGGGSAANTAAAASAANKTTAHSRTGKHLPNDIIDISDEEAPRRRRRTRSRSHKRSRSRSRSNSRASLRHARYARSRHANRSRERTRTRSRSLSSLSDMDYKHRAAAVASKSARSSHARAAHIAARSEAVEYYSRARFNAAAAAAAAAHHYAHAPSVGGHYRVMDSSQYPKYEDSLSPFPKQQQTTQPIKVELPPEEDEGPLTVVAVLRLLTALEDKLGSLGPKVVDLLGKALALEKIKANSADDMLLNEDHCVFFETIKEKLKGLLLAEMIEDPQQVRAVKKAIRNIAGVVHQVSQKGTSNKSSSNDDDSLLQTGISKTVREPANIDNLPFDRQMVASKLAFELVKEECDLSKQDMDKLIFYFVHNCKLATNRPIEVKRKIARTVMSSVGITVRIAAPSITDSLIDKASSRQEILDEATEDGMQNNNESAESSNGALDSLTDSDLQTLLQNFKHLSSEEQRHLIAHLKKLENMDAKRVEKLRKFIDPTELPALSAAAAAGGGGKPSESKTEAQQKTTAAAAAAGSKKRFSNSPAATTSAKRSTQHYSDDELDAVAGNTGVSGISVKVTGHKINANKFSLDDEDEDDDYNYDDFFKANSNSNVRRVSEERSRSSMRSESNTALKQLLPESSADALTFKPAALNAGTQNVIANIMGSLEQSNASKQQEREHVAVPAPVPRPVPPLTTQTTVQYPHQQQQQQHQQQPMPGNMPYYQHNQQAAAYAGNGYNEMNMNDGYYNNSNNMAAAAAYNNNNMGYAGYAQPQPQQAWPQQQYANYNAQAAYAQQQMGGAYNMYGQGGGR